MRASTLTKQTSVPIQTLEEQEVNLAAWCIDDVVYHTYPRQDSEVSIVKPRPEVSGLWLNTEPREPRRNSFVEKLLKSVVSLTSCIESETFFVISGHTITRPNSKLKRIEAKNSFID